METSGGLLAEEPKLGEVRGKQRIYRQLQTMSMTKRDVLSPWTILSAASPSVVQAAIAYLQHNYGRSLST